MANLSVCLQSHVGIYCIETRMYIVTLFAWQGMTNVDQQITIL